MRYLSLLVIIGMLLATLPVGAQDGGCVLPPRLTIGRHAVVMPQGALLNARQEPGVEAALVGQLAAGDLLEVLDGPRCIAGLNWWQVNTMMAGAVWIAEGADGEYWVEPYVFMPEPPVPLDVPITVPVITTPAVPLPAAIPAGRPSALTGGFVEWNWGAFLEGSYDTGPDPLALQLPDAYTGDFPVPPVDLSSVYFVVDAGLSDAQLALLVQNGFVVVPGGYPQFDQVYTDGTWLQEDGKGDFITTDALLHALFVTYQNALMFLEQGNFYGQVAAFVGGGYAAAEEQWAQAAGTPLEENARRAAIYYAVPLILLADGESSYVNALNQETLFSEGDVIPSARLKVMNPAIRAEAEPIVAMIRAAEGRLDVPILDDLEEDFSQYKARGYYEGSPLLESYFRAMMWLGRITFKARSEADTLTGLLALRALLNSGAYDEWQAMAETLAFLVGPMDDLNPAEYGPLAAQTFGDGLPLDALADPARLDTFLAGVAALPGPRVNSLPLPVGITAEQVDEFTRGFRLFGQRFTLDGYIMQQLIYPEVGTAQQSRALPLGLDIAAALGSDHAYVLADQAGATAYQNYTENLAALRGEINGMAAEAWLENLYGGWLWALQPLLVRDPDLVPPLMQTDAWKYRDIHATLGSWTELKHATLLYAEQPYGGLGGGGFTPPVTSTSIVEPNPEVFARIAIVAAALSQGLDQRGYLAEGWLALPIDAVDSALHNLAVLSARLAEMARKEIAGEELTYDELYFLQEQFGQTLWYIRYEIEQWIPEPPETVALVADVASNPSAGTVLEEAIGEVDLIYVVASGPHGLHLTRGAVYSQYEFTQPIDSRLTDDEWRAMVAAGALPPRHAWTSLYFGE